MTNEQAVKAEQDRCILIIQTLVLSTETDYRDQFEAAIRAPQSEIPPGPDAIR